MIKKVYRKITYMINSHQRMDYQINGFMLDMGVGHALPECQKNFLMYDRIIPFLGGGCDKETDWVVDIGANVGDTVAALVKSVKGRILCVEPSDDFHQLLQKNVKGFGMPYSEKIKIEKAFIALDTDASFSAERNRGTAVRKETGSGKSEAPVYTLPGLLKKNKIALEDVILIKIDTDGYDSDCILSMGNDLKGVSPILYWENEILDSAGYEQYKKMAEYLMGCGYTDFFIFDNFGNYLGKGDASFLQNINDYVWRIERGVSARTIYYVDVLACKDDKVQLCKGIVKKYLKNIMRLPTMKENGKHRV